jgi:hypothetical protein
MAQMQDDAFRGCFHVLTGSTASALCLFVLPLPELGRLFLYYNQLLPLANGCNTRTLADGAAATRPQQLRLKNALPRS